MKKITEKRGELFSVTLSDETTLCLQGGESKNIKDELVSDSLLFARHLGIVSIEDAETTKEPKPKKDGGAK